MKGLFTALSFFFIPQIFFGQAVSFSALAPADGELREFQLTELSARPEQLNEMFSTYRIFEAPLDMIHDFSASQSGSFRLAFQFGPDETLAFQVSHFPLWDGNATLHIASETGVEEYPMPAPTTYRGHLVGNPGAKVACTFADGYSSGLILYGDHAEFWEPLFRLIPNAPHNWIIRYNVADAIAPAGARCTVEAEAPLEQSRPAAPKRMHQLDVTRLNLPRQPTGPCGKNLVAPPGSSTTWPPL
ncbi:MAG: hypothetical protein IPL65_14685 [Lewinellaceae bacterium]|nr:hypothetical protein [Lewinellaceae bacterium]